MTERGIESRWGYLLKRVQHDLRGRIDSALAALDLTASQYAVLTNLEEAHGLSNAELARRSFVTPQTMIRIVTRLQQRGLVSRTSRHGNARVLDTELTEAGRSAVAAGHVIVDKVEAEMSARLTADERTTFTELLGKLVR